MNAHGESTSLLAKNHCFLAHCRHFCVCRASSFQFQSLFYTYLLLIRYGNTEINLTFSFTRISPCFSCHAHVLFTSNHHYNVEMNRSYPLDGMPTRFQVVIKRAERNASADPLCCTQHYIIKFHGYHLCCCEQKIGNELGVQQHVFFQRKLTSVAKQDFGVINVVSWHAGTV